MYDFISYTDAKAKAEGLYTKTQNNVISRLCSGYAWDTALQFIETRYPNYATNGKGDNYYGNYADTTFTYTAIDGTSKTKTASSDGTGTKIPTGQTTPVNNIYDMGGNVVELTTELANYNSRVYCTQRGGCATNISNDGPAAVRWCIGGGQYDSIGFRVTLFI